MPTVIGVIFFIFGLYFFFFREEGLVGLLVVSAIFQAASAVNFGERGLQPYYIVAAFIIIRGTVNRLLSVTPAKKVPFQTSLLLFAAISIASAFLLPFMFVGIPVYDPKLGIDQSLFVHPPLSFGLNNVAQAGFLIWHVATLYGAQAIKFSYKKTQRAYILSFYLLVLFIGAQTISRVAGIHFPDEVIRNNPGYSLGDLADEQTSTRIPGTFAEPSFGGAFLVLYCVGFTVQYLSGRGSKWLVIISLVASGLIASSGSLVVLALFILLLLVLHQPFRFPWFINVDKAKRLAGIAVWLGLPSVLAIAGSASYRQTLLTLTVSKGDSGSFINRTASDLFALQLLSRTYGIGVGLGSNRASSLVTSLLSNVGVLGFALFAMFYFRLLRGLSKEMAWLRWGGFAVLLNMCVDIPDITFPLVWVIILLAVQMQTAIDSGSTPPALVRATAPSTA
jgi:hypothetical protein